MRDYLVAVLPSLSTAEVWKSQQPREECHVVGARAFGHAPLHTRRGTGSGARATAAAQKEVLVGALVLLIRCTAIYRRIS